MAIDYLILKVAGKCNLACRYCYYMNGLAEPFRSAMALTTVRELFQKYLDYCLRRELTRVSFAWHGGEPLLAGKQFFRAVLQLQGDLFGHRLRCRNLIQTNATLIDDEWAELLQAARFCIGVSLDGSPESHDRNRRDRAGRGSWARTCAGIATLQRHGVRFGTITVIDPQLNGRHAFEHCYALGIRKMEFNLPIGLPASLKRLPIGAYGRFLCEVFDAWIDKDDPSVEIGSLSSVIRLMAGGRATHCHSANNCSRYVTIEPNGDVGSCENFRVLEDPAASSGWLTRRPSSPYLLKRNILTSDFEEIDEALRSHFHEWRINVCPDNCQCCPVSQICHAGCSAHRYRQGQGFNVANCFCDYYQRIIAHVAQRIQQESTGCVQ
jgi:uncharacterized protein